MEITPAVIKKVARDVAEMHRKAGASIIMVCDRQPEETVVVNIMEKPTWVPRLDVGQKTIAKMFWDVRRSKVLTQGKRTLAVWSMADPNGEFGEGKTGGSYVGLGIAVTEERAKRLNRRYPKTAFMIPIVWDMAP